MRVRKVAFALVMSVVLFAGGASPVRAAPLDLRIRAGQTDAEQLRNAFLSVEAYIEKRRPVLRRLISEVGVEAVPLEIAVKKIMDLDRDDLAPIRRRRLAIRLLAYARNESEAVQAVKKLIGPRQTTLVMHRLPATHSGSPENHADPPPPRDPPGPTFPPPARPPIHATTTTLATTDDGHDRDTSGARGDPEERLVSDLVAQVAGPLRAGSCQDWKAWSYVGAPGTGNDVSISVVAQARQTLDYAKKNLDPQSWAGCSRLWNAAYLTSVENGHVIMDPSTNKPLEVTQPKGDPYSGYLYEHFVCDDTKSPFPCSLEVVLAVDTYVPTLGDGYIVTYGDPMQLSGAQNVVVDRGWVEATRNGSTLDVNSDKTLGFGSRDDARVLYLLLKMIDVGIYMEELVCCP